MTDPLTGLPSRGTIVQLVEQELRRRTTSPGPLAIVLLDVNDFREVNKEHGIPGGDEVLRQLGSLLISTVRPGKHVGRFGGDLFLVLAPETDSQQAELLGEQIRFAVGGAAFSVRGSEIKITVRLGIAVADAGRNPDFEEMRNEAAVAMDKDQPIVRDRFALANAIAGAMRDNPVRGRKFRLFMVAALSERILAIVPTEYRRILDYIETFANLSSSQETNT
jgi:diguanylate cyclase (GGDEF)-like protein